MKKKAEKKKKLQERKKQNRELKKSKSAPSLAKSSTEKSSSEKKSVKRTQSQESMEFSNLEFSSSSASIPSYLKKRKQHKRTMRPLLSVVPPVTRVIQRKFHTTKLLRMQDNWDQEALPGANVPFNIESKWGLATTLILYVATAVAVPFFAMRWQLLKKRAG